MAWNVRHQRPVVSARARPEKLPERLQQMLEQAERTVTEPFKGITAYGQPVRELFPIRPTGISTQPITDAAKGFLAALGPEQKTRACFPVDGDAWRRWSNIHPFIMRHGVSLDEMSEPQRKLALALVQESLSHDGFRTARDVMKLNELVRVLTGSHDEYGEWLYWMSLMGAPSPADPWGWQIDGHHLIVNCFVLGDQVVMTPMFMGSEPVTFPNGARAFDDEERQGLALIRALTDGERRRAILSATLPGEAFTAAFRDNFEMRHEGLRYGELSTAQQALLSAIVSLYVGRIRPGHADVRMDEVKRHLADTHFAWMGGTDATSPFYYRVHSPVLLIEFDHQRGIVFDNDTPSRHHIHTVVRTPNGNDYGRDLLRQHHAQFDHSRADHRHR
jgi:hypothetical protein